MNYIDEKIEKIKEQLKEISDDPHRLDLYGSNSVRLNGDLHELKLLKAQAEMIIDGLKDKSSSSMEEFMDKERHYEVKEVYSSFCKGEIDD